MFLASCDPAVRGASLRDVDSIDAEPADGGTLDTALDGGSGAVDTSPADAQDLDVEVSDSGAATDADVAAADTGSGGWVGEEDPSIDAIEALRAASTDAVTVEFTHGFASTVVGRWPTAGATALARARSFIGSWPALYPLEDERIQLVAAGVVPGRATTVRFEQRYNGYSVHRASMVVILDEDAVFATLGRLVPTGVVVPSRPGMTAHQALTRLREDVALREAHLVGTPELVVTIGGLGAVPEGTPAMLSWRIALAHGASSAIHLVDSTTGRVVASEAMAYEDALYDQDLDLEDANETSGDLCWFETTANDKAGDEDGVFPGWEFDLEINSLWRHAKQAYYYLCGSHGYESYDNDGEWWEVFGHASAESAYYNSFCDQFVFIDEHTGGVDVVVHEVTHAVIAHTSELVYCNQSGALNESFADLLGAFADDDLLGGKWLIGEDTPGGAIRSLAEPELFGQPSRMSDYVVMTRDEGGVHTNSGIPNHAGYLLVEGGELPDRTIQGLGQDAGSDLLFATMESLPSSSTFSAAAYAAVTTARIWSLLAVPGFDAQAVCDVRNAYWAVGVLAGDRDCDGVVDPADDDDDQDGVADSDDNCPAVSNPLQINTDFDPDGDACDEDRDNDGVPDDEDNCRTRSNADQLDVDADGVGDVCVDWDLDGVKDGSDNCIHDPNPSQSDVDLDREGDACDPDTDGDGQSDNDDNCPFDADPSESDRDGDGTGDVCDRCPGQADGVAAWTTGVPELGIDPAPMQPDVDGDGTPDACDDTAWGDRRAARAGRLPVRASEAFVALDGVSRQYTLEAEPGQVMSFVLPQCVACPEDLTAIGPQLTFTGLGAGVRVWVSDALGYARARTGSPEAVSAVPVHVVSAPADMGGSLRINFAFGPDFGGTTTFTVEAVER